MEPAPMNTPIANINFSYPGVTETSLRTGVMRDDLYFRGDRYVIAYRDVPVMTTIDLEICLYLDITSEFKSTRNILGKVIKE